MDSEPTIGRRIRELRGSALTQMELATAADVSVDLVRKLEQGRRHTVSIASLHRLAGALDVDTGELLGRTTTLPEPGEHSGVAAIRRVLTGIGDLLADAGQDAPAMTVAEARRTVTFAWGAYWAGRYDQLGDLLPGALAQLDATVREAATGDVAEAHDLAAQLHQVTANTMVQLGRPDAAFLALRRGLDLAARSDDPQRPATLRCSLAWTLLTQGRFDEAERLAVDTAERIEPMGAVGAPHVSLWGSCLLTGATAAGRGQRGDRAGELLAAAAGAVERNGSTDRTDYESPFGPSQLVMQTVDVHVVTEEHTQALDAARSMPRRAGLPTAARCRHLVDVAQAHTRLGHDEAALSTLLVMEQTSPSWTRYQALPRQVVRELIEQERGGRTPRLRALAGRLGVATA